MTTREQRARHVARVRHSFGLEGMKGDEMDAELEQAYIDGTVSLKDMLFAARLFAAVHQDDGAAAKSHLAAGRPIYYCEDAYPEIIREWPDGRRELVELEPAGTIKVLREL